MPPQVVVLAPEREVEGIIGAAVTNITAPSRTKAIVLDENLESN